MGEPFETPREAARAVLTCAWDGGAAVTPKAAQFLGQVSVDSEPLTEKQASWLGKLLDRAGLPPLADGERP